VKLLFLDTETTGLSQVKGAKIVEIAFLTYELESRELKDVWVQRIDPEQPIEPGAQEVHGIAYSDLVGCPKWNNIASDVALRMGGADLLLAHNMGFDGPFIAGELIRVGITVPDVYSFCTMESARWACPDGKYPKLSELAFALGVEYDPAKAHAAQYDVEVTAECFFRGLDRGFYELPKELKTSSGFQNCYGEAA